MAKHFCLLFVLLVAPTDALAESFGDLVFAESGKLAVGVILALLTAVLGWTVGVAVTARWELAKKRMEADVALAQEFHEAVAGFKSIGREWGTLRDRINAVTEPAERVAHDVVRDDLRKRAIAVEQQLEGILLKVSTDPIGPLVPPHDGLGRRGRQHTIDIDKRLEMLGLLRVGFRLLREGIDEQYTKPPSFGDAEWWLMNRLFADTAQWLFERQAVTVDQPKSEGTGVERFLRIIAYRTIDYELAAGRLDQSSKSFKASRRADRKADRTGKSEHLAEGGCIEMPPQGFKKLSTERQLEKVVAMATVARNNGATFHVVPADNPIRLYLTTETGTKVLNAGDPLPKGVCKDGGTKWAWEILQWSQSSTTRDHLFRIATEEIVRSLPATEEKPTDRQETAYNTPATAHR